MIHEPECVFAGTHLQKDSCGTCNRLRTAYKRGREDAADAVSVIALPTQMRWVGYWKSKAVTAALGGDM